MEEKHLEAAYLAWKWGHLKPAARAKAHELHMKMIAEKDREKWRELKSQLDWHERSNLRPLRERAAEVAHYGGKYGEVDPIV